MRDYKLYLEDILQAIDKIEKYTKGLNADRLKKEDLIVDGVVRNLEIIGEAAKNIPQDIKKKHPDIEWKKIAGLRDILAHEYFGIDLQILWDIIKNKLPELKTKVTPLMK
ncbi:MAG: DUF86 domain-containing protein [Candidatus Omnitrophica bacterium]|nr:DUF86 domain-containing protein [Candidatus Omnitrophota bacterium]MBU4590483.1 DUF86 domain-containing protein [Candidatus Omnitrophota bacterium]